MDEIRGHGVVNIEAYNTEMECLEHLALEMKECVERLKNMPKVVTNLEDVIAE